MTPLQALRAAVSEFEKRQHDYCLIGGHAASLYRINERVTGDVDFALVCTPVEVSVDEAKDVLRALGLKPILGFIPGAREEGQRGKVAMITSSPGEGSLTGVIDIILPSLPWVVNAVARAQSNRIDLGFSRVPVITPEDLIVAKAYALTGAPDRFQDLDDLKEIFSAVPDLDLEYIKLKLERLGLFIPEILKAFVPPRLKEFCK